MTQPESSLEKAGHHAEQAARQAARNPWVERLARAGFAAKGLVYIIVGVLAAQAAMGAGGETTDPQGALRAIVTRPFGAFLLGAITVGLIGHALWRFVQALVDPEHKGADVKGIGTRIGYAGVGVVYVGFAFSAVRLMLGRSDNGAGNAQQGLTARLLAQPFGQWLLILIGAGVAAFGLFQIYLAYTTKFRQKLKLGEMSPREEQWITRIGQFGIAARGVVFGIIGIFLIQAAIQHDPGKAEGVSGALQALARQPSGPWLLGIVALGLIAYGGYMLINTRYRRIAIS